MSTPIFEPTRLAVIGAAAALVIGGAAAASAQMVGAEGGWGGGYLGFAPGVKLGSATWTATLINGGVANGSTPATAPDASSPRTYDLTAARIGGYAGFNWQYGPWVVGPEAAFAWADAKQTRAFMPGCSLGCGGFSAPAGPNDTASVRLGWDGNIGARAGYLVTPDMLLYGTSGLALQQVETTGACHNPSIESQYCFGPGPQPPIKHDLTLVGVTVGAGLETAISGNWRLRGEYRFSYFPSVNDTLPFPPSETGANNTYRYRLSSQTHILTMGLAYKF
jgi:outer membrane immunogenic protein